MTNHMCMAMALKLKTNHPNGKRFVKIEEIKEKSKQELLAILKNMFQNCFEDWILRGDKINKYILFEKISNNGYFLITSRTYKHARLDY